MSLPAVTLAQPLSSWSFSLQGLMSIPVQSTLSQNHFCELKNACFLTLKLKFLTSLPFTLSLLTPLKITNWNLYFIRLHAVKTSDLNPNHSGQHPQVPAPLLLYCVYLAMFWCLSAPSNSPFLILQMAARWPGERMSSYRTVMEQQMNSFCPQNCLDFCRAILLSFTSPLSPSGPTVTIASHNQSPPISKCHFIFFTSPTVNHLSSILWNK